MKTRSAEVVIAGGGIAASAAALRLLALGFHPTLLVGSQAPREGTEALSPRTLDFLAALDALEVLELAGAVQVEGFAVEEGTGGSRRASPFVHVERVALARALLHCAHVRGAWLVRGDRVPHLAHDQDGGVSLAVGGRLQRFAAALDATGRGAVWSRPAARERKDVAWVYRLPPERVVRPACMARSVAGWGYRIGSREALTLGWLPASPRQSAPPLEILERLASTLERSRAPFARPAWPQWSSLPVRGARLAVGDAALAHHPVSGQGVRFALSSALAAAAVVRTWVQRPHDAGVASAYYEELVTSERMRHLRHLAAQELGAEATASAAPALAGELGDPAVALCLAAPVRIVGVQREGWVSPAEAFALPDGTSARWLGNFDLLRLRALVSPPRPRSELARTLVLQGLALREAQALIAWCLSHGVLSVA